MNIKKYADWEKMNESNSLNEFLGLSGLFKAFFKSLSEPVKKKVEIITNNIDSKTGNVKNSKQLTSDLFSTFKVIADDKKADLKGVDDIDTFKDVMKEFLSEIKAVFTAARIPFTSLAESEDIEFDEFILTEEELINEKKSKAQRKIEVAKKHDTQTNQPAQEDTKPTGKVLTIAEIMTKGKPDEFEDQVDTFLNNWIEKLGGDKNMKKLESEGIKLIDTMMKKFNDKIKAFGPERLQKLIKLATENPTPKKEEIKKILDEKPSTEEDGKPVETDDGKQQIMKAVEKSLKNGAEMLKIKDGESWNIVVKGVKF